MKDIKKLLREGRKDVLPDESIKNNIIPIRRSEADAGILNCVWIALDPRSSIAINTDTTSIPNGFIFASQATVMAVNPTPPAVPSVMV